MYIRTQRALAVGVSVVTTNKTNRLYDVNINTLSVDNGKFYFNAYDLVFGWLIFEFI